MTGSFWRRVKALFGRTRLGDELSEELQGHFDDLCQLLESEGHAPDQARRLARLRLGGAVQLREQASDQWRFAWLEGVGQDLRLAVRSLKRRPGFAASAIATLALGIGASTAIFSVAYGVSLRPLAYGEPERLIRIYEANPQAGQFKQDVSNGAFQDWRTGVSAVESAAMYSMADRRTIANEDGQRVITMQVSPAFFDVLGVRPMIGTGFMPERDYPSNAVRDIVLSHHIWQQVYGGHPDIIGQTLSLTGVASNVVFTVVGVMPRDFRFTEDVDVYLPQLVAGDSARIRLWRDDRVIARLAPGASIERARAELEAAAGRSAKAFPAGAVNEMYAAGTGWTTQAESLHDSVIGGFGRATWLLLSAVIVVLLVACLNVGGLLVVRAVAREREAAVRVALGAGRWRLVRLWLCESVLVCAIGAALGLLLANLGVSSLRAIAPPGIPRIDAIQLDWPTLLMAALSTLFAAVVFTIAPLGQRGPDGQIRNGGRVLRPGVQRSVVRQVLAAAQCAGAAALVVLAVMLSRSLLKLTAVDLGWQAQGVLSAQTSPNRGGMPRRPWYARVEWTDRLIARLEESPGVKRAAVTTQLPLSVAPYSSTLARGQGAKAGDAARWRAVQHKVSDGYFALMRLQPVAGRVFDERDRFTESQMIESEVRPKGGVAVVTEETARTLWPGQSAMGQMLYLPDIDTVEWRQVIGIVRDIQFHAVGEAPGLHVFTPWTQDSASARVHVLVAAADGKPEALTTTMRQLLKTVEPGASVDGVVSLEELVTRATAQPRFTSWLVVGFGALALLLAAVGIYGTLAYLVGATTREIGIRLALGAQRQAILSHVYRHGLLPALVGCAIGCAVALGLRPDASEALAKVT